MATQTYSIPSTHPEMDNWEQEVSTALDAGKDVLFKDTAVATQVRTVNSIRANAAGTVTYTTLGDTNVKTYIPVIGGWLNNVGEIENILTATAAMGLYVRLSPIKY